MHIIHFSDTHLGFQAYDNVDDNGINAREQDVYDAFERIVDRICAEKPDVVIHSGDFFHRPSPSNRALTFGMEQLRRVCDLDIPLVVISGNHETPKTVYTSPILRALRTLHCVYPAFGDVWEKWTFGDVTVHAMPHINDYRKLFEELEKLQPVEGSFNILMLHTSLGKRYLMEEYGEQVFPPEFEEKLQGFQYVALGHWHNYQQVNLHPNAWYSGSTERFSDTEIGAEKGFINLKLAADGTFTNTFEAIPTRPWLKFESHHCHALSVDELREKIKSFAVENDTRGAIMTLVFNDIRVEQSLEISNQHLREIFPHCFQLLPKRRMYNEKSHATRWEAQSFDSLDKLFSAYVREQYRDDEAMAQKLAQKAASFFNQH
ncbi:MAG: DNA repair exonuclease [Saprospiraceae bacterium]|nr:DNA repair exonuclease [Saprospiraceae bacterium]